MATNLLSLRPIAVRASAGAGPQRSDRSGRKTSSNSANWWTPLFGMSSEPDYIGSESKSENIQDEKENRSKSDLSLKAAKSRFSPGCFTEEKAKQLRMMTYETASFHDVMYHSAIASRLASDFKNRPDR